MIGSTVLALLGWASGVGIQQLPAGAPKLDPPVRVWLSRDERLLLPGDRVRVYLKTARDGYVLVLHAEPSGRVRVLFPLDPTGDNFVRGGKKYEARGRGDREALAVHDSAGSGVIYAAFSPEPFRLESLAAEGQWDYRQEAFRVGDDPEADLTALVGRLASAAGFSYDLIRYDVAPRGVYARRPRYFDPWYGGWYPWFRVGVIYAPVIGPRWHPGGWWLVPTRRLWW